MQNPSLLARAIAMAALLLLPVAASAGKLTVQFDFGASSVAILGGFVNVPPDGSIQAASGELDFAIGVFRPLHRHGRNGAGTQAADAGHLVAPLFQVGMATIVRRDHPRVGRKLDLDTFCALDHVLVTDEPWATGLLDGLLAKHKRKRRIAVRVPRHISVGWIIARTDLLATLDDRIAHLHAVAHDLRVLDPPLSVKPAPLSMLWHERTDRDPARRWLREQLRAVGIGCGEASRAWLAGRS